MAPRERITVRTLSPMAPRWTGTCGALATSAPVASNTAQEKSSRSLMLTDRLVFCSTAPVCSAALMKRLLNSSSITGSGRAASATRAAARVSVRRSSRWLSAVTSAVQPGSTTVVALASRISAGPGMRSSRRSASRSNTGAWCSEPAVQSATVSIGAGGSPPSRGGSAASSTSSPAAVTSATQASTTTSRSGVAKPKRWRCAAVKASSTSACAPKGTGRKLSVPA